MGEARVPGPPWFVAWVADWRRAQRRRRLASTSLRTWTVYVRDFGTFLTREGITTPRDLTREVVQRWQDSLLGRLQPSSQQVAVTALRSLLKWTDREELSVHSGLWAWLEAPHVDEKDPRVLEPAELGAILRHYARPRRDLAWMRDRALFWFLVTSDCRISEALQVERSQLRAGGPIVVVQKGGDEHRVVISSRARQWVTEYLQIRGRDDQPALWVRQGARGRHRLRADDANEIWERLAVQLGLQHFTSHSLRHTGVTELGAHDVGDEDIRAQAGWKSSAIMRRYRHVRDDRRQALVDRLDDLVPEPPPPTEGARGGRRRRFKVVGG